MTIQTTTDQTEMWITTKDRRTGRPLYVAVPSQSVLGKFHLVSSVGCDCRGFAYRQTCRHWIAVMAEAAKRQPAPSALQTRESGPAPFVGAPSVSGTLSGLDQARLRAEGDALGGVEHENVPMADYSAYMNRTRSGRAVVAKESW